MLKKRITRLFMSGVVAAIMVTVYVGTTVFADSTASQTVAVTTIIDHTITLAVSNNSIDFGHTNPLVDSYVKSFTGIVQSNDTFSLTAAATDDFKSSDAPAKVYSIDHLRIKTDNDSDYKVMSKDPSNPTIIAENQPATASTTFSMSMQLKTDWLNAAPAGYSTTVAFTASQLQS